MPVDKNEIEKSDNNSENSKKNEPANPEIFDSFMEGAPKEIKDTFRALYSYSGPPKNPLDDKVNSEHITSMIALSGKDSERDYKFAVFSKWMEFGYFAIGICVIIFLIVFLAPKYPDILWNILSHGAALLAGAGTGYGISKRKSK